MDECGCSQEVPVQGPGGVGQVGCTTGEKGLKTNSAVFTEQEKVLELTTDLGDTLNPNRQSSPHMAFDLGSVVGALLRNAPEKVSEV